MKRILLLIILMVPGLAMPATAQTITDRDRQTTINEIARLLEQRYVDPDSGTRLAIALRQNSRNWRRVHSGPELARLLTLWLREQSNDGHFAVDYSADIIPQNGGEASYSADETERYYGSHVNHGVQRVERLDGNIMLLDLRVFPPPSLAGDVISAAMTLVAQGDALIIDLRSNGGGMETVNLVTGYLLPPNSPLSGTFDRPSGQTRLQFSPSSVSGRRFGETKPLYIVTSRRTFSAAEALAYDLQALGRATIIGETTGGGANPFEYRRVHTHFALSLPEQRSVNPITGTNWQGVGVRPDVSVSADEALNTAIAIARQRLARPESTQP
jgi:hypothetical protein